MKKKDLIIKKVKNKRVWGRIKIMNDLMAEIEKAIHQLASDLRSVSIYAGEG